MVPGTQYGVRVSGPWDPSRGQFANPAKLLVDPWARGVSHASPLMSSFFPMDVDSMLEPVGDGTTRSSQDSGPDAVWSVVTEDVFDWRGDAPPRIPWDRSIIYELHVKGFTRLHPEVPPEQRGTYAGLAHPRVIEHLQRLGVTAVELLPIHACMDEPHLTRLGLHNYWGYSTLSYFAPNPAYATRAAQHAGADAVADEVRTMIRTLHAAGIEVLLDVVYNHTAEGGAMGPSLSLRGLDAAEYYWMEGGQFVDVTGTGGTLDPRSGPVVDLVLGSLRHWVESMHVDGFRFDLAATLGRDHHGFRSDHPLLRAMVTDPVLREVKLIAEPWDVGTGGWQTGSFPAPFAEWNDAFRDDVRSFWLADRALRERTGDHSIGGVRDLATRLSASSDIFTRTDPEGMPPGRSLRAPWSSVNYVTAHDGHTLADLTAYETKRNHANGEDGRDGTNNNRSWNHGHEGPLDESVPEAVQIAEERRRSIRAILSTLLLASGTPMLTAGDEFARTQGGNNNAYCQDNEISWVDWTMDPHREGLVQTVASLTALRRRFPQLRATRFLQPADPTALDCDQVAWFGSDGRVMDHDAWMDGRRHLLVMLRPAPAAAQNSAGEGDGERPGHLLVVLSSSSSPQKVTLPPAPWPQGETRILLDTAVEPAHPEGTDGEARLSAHLVDRHTLVVAPGSVTVIEISS